MIKREVYLNKIKSYIDLNLVKVITGIRRSWKTYFMKQIINYLIEEKWINNENIVYIDKENLEFDFINDYKDLDGYIKKKISWFGWKKYIFIDEIQDISLWEKTIRNYLKNDDYDIYITWSNSNLLSSELSTFLTWRYIEFHIYPLSFKEFLDFRWKNKQEIKEEFYNYIKFWWLPAIHNMNFDNEMIYSYISWVFHSILFKDIVARYSIRNSSLLLDIFKFLADNIWNVVSSKKISDYLKNEKINISVDTLREYLGYFQNTFLLDKVQRYDLKWKKLLDLYEKYYMWDLWFRNYLLWYKIWDISQLLENVVYLELKTRWYEITIWKISDLEVDFIAKKDWIIEYYQVTYILINESTINREFWVFDSINDNYPKYVLSMDEIFDNNRSWILRLNIIDWILNK